MRDLRSAEGAATEHAGVLPDSLERLSPRFLVTAEGSASAAGACVSRPGLLASSRLSGHQPGVRPARAAPIGAPWAPGAEVVGGPGLWSPARASSKLRPVGARPERGS